MMLAKSLKVPFLNKKDSSIWAGVTASVSEKLHRIIKARQNDFKKFYATLKASRHTNNAFGEFFCWYYHLAYVWAIDGLAQQGFITIPSDRYQAVVMYIAGPEGLLAR